MAGAKPFRILRTDGTTVHTGGLATAVSHAMTYADPEATIQQRGHEGNPDEWWTHGNARQVENDLRNFPEKDLTG